MSAPDDPYAQPWGGYGPPPSALPPYAHWLQRVGATLLDWLLLVASMLPAFFGLVALAGEALDDSGNGPAAGTVALVVVGALVPVAVWIWNYWREGTRGATVGKQILGLAVVKESTGAFLGGWLALGRQLLHAVDSALCYLGYLWPLWDSKRQTFADKIAGTVVVRRAP